VCSRTGRSLPTTVFVINRICRLIVKRKGIEVSVSSGHQPGAVGVGVLPECIEARLSGLAKPTVKDSSMRHSTTLVVVKHAAGAYLALVENGASASGLRTHTAVIIQHCVQ
jgi:hypothetical protein